jgi:hypothetical protein
MNEIGVSLLLILSFVFVKTKAQNFDVSLLQSIYKNETPFKDKFFKADAQSVTVFNIAASVSIFAVGLIKHDKQLQKNAVYIAGAYIASSIVTQGLKQIVKRERPFEQYPLLFSDRYDGWI